MTGATEREAGRDRLLQLAEDEIGTPPIGPQELPESRSAPRRASALDSRPAPGRPGSCSRPTALERSPRPPRSLPPADAATLAQLVPCSPPVGSLEPSASCEAPGRQSRTGPRARSEPVVDDRDVHAGAVEARAPGRHDVGIFHDRPPTARCSAGAIDARTAGQARGRDRGHRFVRQRSPSPLTAVTAK